MGVREMSELHLQVARVADLNAVPQREALTTWRCSFDHGQPQYRTFSTDDHIMLSWSREGDTWRQAAARFLHEYVEHPMTPKDVPVFVHGPDNIDARMEWVDLPKFIIKQLGLPPL